MKKICFFLLLIFSLSCSNKKVSNNVIRVSVGSEPQSIDPTFVSAIDSMIYTTHFFEGLTTKDKDNNIVAGVAESWDISEDGLKIVFHLRDNAKWSDGKTVEASEFVYSFRRLVNPKISATYSFLMGSIKNANAIMKGELPVEELGVYALDDRTFVVEFEYPTAYFLELTATPMFSPLRAEYIEGNDNWTLSSDTYIGNGPYKMIERRQDEIISLELNTNYWNKDSIKAKRIDFVIFADTITAYNALKSGDILYSVNVPKDNIDSIREEGYLVSTPSLGTAYYAINNTNSIFQDVRVRKALTLAIDRNYIVENITKGGERPAGAFVPYGLNDIEGDFRENGGDYYSVSKDDYEANIEEARALLLEAGYSNNFPIIEFKTNPGNGVIIAEAVQDMLKKHLNIDMRIIQEEWAVFQRSRQSKDYMICRADWIGDYLDPMTFLDLFVSTSSGNRVVYNDSDYDKLILEAKSTVDNGIRMANMHEAEDLLIGRDFAFIPLYYYTAPSMQSKKLKGVVVDTLEIRRFFYCYIE